MATSTTVTTVAQTDRCPRCPGTDIDHSATETYCRDCGMVIDESPIDHGPDWGFSDDESDPERAAPGNRDMHDRGLGSRFNPTDSRSERLKTQHTRARIGNTVDRNRGYATEEIHRMTAALDLPQYVGKRAKYLFRRIHAEGLNGADLDTVAAACLYAATREQELGRVPSEIAAVARTSESKVKRRLLSLQRDLDLELPPPSPVKRTRVVAGKLPVDAEARERAVSRVERLDDVDTAGIAPSVIAALALWQASDLTQADICDAAGVTPTALRRYRNELEDKEINL